MSGFRIFAIGDLHLSLAAPKPMDVFGPSWSGHAEKLAEAWRMEVSEEDLVLLPGDLSWAMRLEEALPDIEWLAALPGRKALLRGNHDHWWPSISKLRRALEGTGIEALQNDCLVFDDVCVVGSRLWQPPGLSMRSLTFRAQPESAAALVGEKRTTPEQNERLWQRELGRLRLSLQAVPSRCERLYAMTHYAPVNPEGEGTEAAEMLERAGVVQCVFGHIHNVDTERMPSFDVRRGGTRYRLVSADFLDFVPLRIA